MIFESHYWKRDIKRMHRRLTKLSKEEEWTDEQAARAERDVMISAFMIRRLMECDKLSHGISNQQVRTTEFQLVGNPPTRFHHRYYWEKFDMEHGRLCTITVNDLTNQIIHSYVFSFATDAEENGNLIFYVSSDRERKKVLYEVQMASYLSLLARVGNDWPSQMQWEWSEKDQDHRLMSSEPKHDSKVL